MTFSWLDFIIGFLFIGASIHLILGHSGKSFKSFFGYSPKANIYHSVLVISVLMIIYVTVNGFNALFNNALLLGMLDMYVCYLIFGPWIHKKFSKQYTHHAGRQDSSENII